MKQMLGIRDDSRPQMFRVVSQAQAHGDLDYLLLAAEGHGDFSALKVRRSQLIKGNMSQNRSSSTSAL